MKQELVFLFDSILMRDENYILGRTLTFQTILFIICFNDSSLKMMKNASSSSSPFRSQDI